jgi:hypothetical protein
MFTGDDLWYHMLRIENIRAGLEAGQFPVRMGTNWLNHYGYASSICYPELFLYIPAILTWMGMSIFRAVKIFLVLCMTGTFLTTYFCGKHISGNRYVGLIAAIIVLLSPHFFSAVYLRGAFGEVEAFVFYPLVIWGLYDFVYGDFEKPYIMGIGFWGLMFSHSISTVCAFCMCVVVCLVQYKRVLFHKKKMIRLLTTAGMVLLTTVTFWAPLLEQMLTNDLNFSETATGVANCAVSLKRIFSIGFDSANFGLPILIFCAGRVFIRKKKEDAITIRNMDWCLLIGCVLLFVTTKLFPWKLLAWLLNPIQFPWRFYCLAVIMMGIAAGYVLTTLGKKWIPAISAVVLVVMAVGMFRWFRLDPIEYINANPEMYSYSYQTFNVGWGEWINKNVDMEALKTVERTVQDENGNTIEYVSLENGGLTFQAESDSSYYDVPYLWFAGYTANMEENGTEKKLEISDEGWNHTIRIDTQGQNGTVTISYTGTKMQKISDGISLLSTAAFAGYLVYMKGSKKRKYICKNA